MQTITLENECTIYEVAEKQQLIMGLWSDQKTDVSFDLSAISEIDVCFIQLLISCKKTALKNNVKFEVVNIPDEVTNKITSAHLTEQLL